MIPDEPQGRRPRRRRSARVGRGLPARRRLDRPRRAPAACSAARATSRSPAPRRRRSPRRSRAPATSPPSEVAFSTTVGRLGHEPRPTAPYTERGLAGAARRRRPRRRARSRDAGLDAHRSAASRPSTRASTPGRRRVEGERARARQVDARAARSPTSCATAARARAARAATAWASTTRARACRAGRSTSRPRATACRCGRGATLAPRPTRPARRARSARRSPRALGVGRASCTPPSRIRGSFLRDEAQPAGRRRSAQGRPRRSRGAAAPRQACSTAALGSVGRLRAAARARRRRRLASPSAGCSAASTCSCCPATARSACACRCASLGAGAPPPTVGRGAARARRSAPRPSPTSAPTQHARASPPTSPTRAEPAARHAHRARDRAARRRSCWVFLPPLPRFERLLRARRRDRSRARARPASPSSSRATRRRRRPMLYRFAVTPDPGRARGQPAARVELRASTPRCSDRCSTPRSHSGLHRRAATCSTAASPAAAAATTSRSAARRRCELAVARAARRCSRACITFVQHHPSLSYLFTGLFVGPTSQAPRVDEARHDALYELEIALAAAFDASTRRRRGWSTRCFRHLLVDVAGSTHRAEISIDKLFDPQTPYGRQGLVELRAFEMPPHPRMAAAQAMLVRALVAAFAAGAVPQRARALGHRAPRPVPAALLHVARLRGRARPPRGAAASPLPAEAYRPFVELRCPLVGTLEVGDVARRGAQRDRAVARARRGGDRGRHRALRRLVDGAHRGARRRPRSRSATCVARQRRTRCRCARHRPRGQRVGGVRFRAWCPPHACTPHLGIHHPLRIDVARHVGAQRSLGACAYHVWHPEGRAFDAPPLTRFEAAARRAQRFTPEAPLPWPVKARPAQVSAENPCTLDLRRLPLDYRPPKPPAKEEAPG